MARAIKLILPRWEIVIIITFFVVVLYVVLTANMNANDGLLRVCFSFHVRSNYTFVYVYINTQGNVCSYITFQIDLQRCYFSISITARAIPFVKPRSILLFLEDSDGCKNHAEEKIHLDFVGAASELRRAVESHPVNYRREKRPTNHRRPTASPIIAGLMVSPVARAASAADPAGLYRERNIPEHPRAVEAIIWSNARRALSVERSDSPKRATDARSWKIADALSRRPRK